MKLEELLSKGRFANLPVALQFPAGDEVSGILSRLYTLCKEMEVVDFTVADGRLVVSVK